MTADERREARQRRDELAEAALDHPDDCAHGHPCPYLGAAVDDVHHIDAQVRSAE